MTTTIAGPAPLDETITIDQLTRDPYPLYRQMRAERPVLVVVEAGASSPALLRLTSVSWSSSKPVSRSGTSAKRRPYFRTIVTTTSTPALPTKGVKAQEVTGGRAGGDAVSLTSVYW